VRVTFLGHAGLYVETSHSSILCDPWIDSPAYYGAWWPYPSNEHIDRAAIARPDYLYVSHTHSDHFDVEFLSRRVWKEATVLLPDYPLGALERALRGLGFRRFLKTRSWQPFEVDGMRLTIPARVSPADGPMGDSGLVVEENGVRLFNQNDSRPIDGLDTLGRVQAHFLQFSGALGYPFLQGYPERMRIALGSRKRRVGMERARRYVELVGADSFFPSSGPPCFLRDDLVALNDLGDDAGNVFPDQRAFLDHMRGHGHHQGRAVYPGTVVHVTSAGCQVEHRLTEAEIAQLESDAGKRIYLADYRARKRTEIERAERSLPADTSDLVAALRDWWEPLMREADVVCTGAGGRLAIDFFDSADQGIVVDFQERTVGPWQGDEVAYHLRLPRQLVEHSVRERIEDWNSELLLSFRYRHAQSLPYNKYVFGFLSALSEERIRYLEDFYRRELRSADYAGQPFFQRQLGPTEYLVQQRCPHAGGDLRRFLEFDEATEVLTCTLHGWQWRRDGTCVTAEGHPLYVRPVDEVDPSDLVVVTGEPLLSGADVRRQCGDCTYRFPAASVDLPRTVKPGQE
jgi:UDP-MurNAc hydroxylase